MKSIGIITTSCNGSGTFACNYGAALQGYALVRQVRLLGFDAYDINYNSKHEYRPQQYSFWKKTGKRFLLLFNPRLVGEKFNEFLKRKDRRLHSEHFRKFIAESSLTYQDGRFYTFPELKKLSEKPEFHAFITGSDLVWNPHLHERVNDEGYFLDFVNAGTKRIAYAPSFGVTDIPEESRRNLKELLEKFDALSVREQSGSDLIKRETGLVVPVVLDPTLLLDPKEYDAIARKPENLPDRYMAVYRFGNIPHTDEKIREISKRLGLPIVFIPSGNDEGFTPRYDLGPGDFIGLIRGAELVVSDSFHCTIFCLINHTPFLTFFRTLPQPGRDINSRMVELLRLVGLENRMVMPGADIYYDQITSVDFLLADETIQRMRTDSLKFLKDALGVDA